MDEMAYCERSGGAWELFVWSDGVRYLVLHTENLAKVNGYARKHGYTILFI